MKSKSDLDHSYINQAIKCSSISIIGDPDAPAALKGSNEFISKYYFIFKFLISLQTKIQLRMSWNLTEEMYKNQTAFKRMLVTCRNHVAN